MTTGRSRERSRGFATRRRGPAVGLLARWPEAGRGKRRLAARVGDEEAARLALAFLRDEAAAVASEELWHAALFVEPASRVGEAAALTDITDVRPQGRGDVGLRMLDAARALEAAGHSPLLLVGADVPLLAPRHLHQALRALRRADVVLGPAEDGGYYLVGMHRVHPVLFDDPALASAWGGPGVLDVSERLARSLGHSTGRIAPELDVDTAEDLQRLRERIAALDPSARPRHTAAALGLASAALDSAARRDR